MEQKQVLDYLRAHKQDITERYHLTKLGIFGSYARGEQTPQSDLDLLVEFEENVPHYHHVIENLREEMQAAFKMPVDICTNLQYVKPYFRYYIQKDAIYV